MTTPKPSRTTPLDHEAYLNHRNALVLSYTESLKEYDRLVTWASAGALGLSITFIEKFGQNADHGTAWLLGVGWLLLTLAFATSLWSQYASSRVHSWRRRELDYLQLEIADRPETWATEAIRLDRVARRYGSATRRLTFISGVLLVGGIVSVATFAFLNAPFKAVEVISDKRGNTPHTATVPDSLEKKGSEHVPEPVRRPQSTPPQPQPQPQPQSQPIEKR